MIIWPASLHVSLRVYLHLDMCFCPDACSVARDSFSQVLTLPPLLANCFWLQKEGKLTPLMLMMLMLWCWCANAFACVWLHFATSDCIWLQLIHLIASGCIQSHLIASDRIWSHLIASDPIGWLSPATHSATHLKPSYWHNPWHDLGAQALTWRRNCTASFQAIWEEGQHTVYVYTVCAKVTCCKNVAAGNVAIMFF